jgi:hypothetical protein
VIADALSRSPLGDPMELCVVRLSDYDAAQRATRHLGLQGAEGSVEPTTERRTWFDGCHPWAYGPPYHASPSASKGSDLASDVSRRCQVDCGVSDVPEVPLGRNGYCGDSIRNCVVSDF